MQSLRDLLNKAVKGLLNEVEQCLSTKFPIVSGPVDL